MRTRLSLGVVGLGEWGRRAARTIAELPRAELGWLCDRDPNVLRRSRDRHPAARTTVDLDDLLGDEGLDAVVVATPSAFRAEIAGRALEADKHVLVREPIALAGNAADELVARAERRRRHLATAGGLIHDPAVRGLARLLERGDLGEVYYLSLRREQPGREGRDVLWDTAVTEVSLVLALLRDAPVEVSAVGEAYVEAAVRDVVWCHLRFATGIAALLHASRVGQRHVREVSAVGSRRTAVVDAAGGHGELSVWEGPDDSIHVLRPELELGTVVTPRVVPTSPLRLECEAFLEALRADAWDDALADARRAAATVNVIEALDESDAAFAPPASELPAAIAGAEVVRLPIAPAAALLPGR
jgi:predicted dehydrogenase